jgi:catechol 2,3-dioxygenase-like lactoylglutathione lyase family enzyme
MLDTCRVHAALPATDLGRARQFYEGTLGLTPARERTAGVRYECGGGSGLFVFPTSGGDRGGHTQAGFEVPDIDAAVLALRARGVAFEEYRTPALQTVDGVATESDGSRAARFEDSEGNLLVLVQYA